MLLSLSSMLRAQSARVSVEGWVGLGRGLVNVDPHAGALIGGRGTVLLARSFLVSVAASREGFAPDGDSCQRPEPIGPCRTQLRINTVSVGAGRQLGTSAHPIRVSAGPTVVYGTDDVTALGIQSQADIVMIKVGRLAIVGSTAAMWLPNYRVRGYGRVSTNRHYGSLQIGLGLRAF